MELLTPSWWPTQQGTAEEEGRGFLQSHQEGQRALLWDETLQVA